MNSRTSQSEAGSVPKGWVLARFGECVDILDSQRVPVNAEERENRITGKSQAQLFPYYGATGQVGWIDDFLFDEELVLLGEDGAPFFDFGKNKAYIIKGKTWVNNHAHVLRAIADLLINRYLCHYLNIFDYHGAVTGTTRPKLNQAPMRRIPIAVAPYPEQKRIVAKIEELFTRLDAGVEGLKKVKAELKRYRQAVLKYAFEGKLTADWREKNKDQLEPASKLLERIAKEREKNAKGKKQKKLPPLDKSNLPELPDGWEWVASAFLYKWANGKGLPTKKIVEGTYPVYGGNGITGHHNQYLFENESIIIGRVGANCGNVHLAPPKSWVTDNAIYSVWKSEHLVSKFFLNLLSSMKLNVLSGGSGQPYVSQLILNPLPLRVPPIQEQQQIVGEIDRHFSIADEVEQTIDKALKQAQRLRQSILKKAFEGKLVPQDPEDEPAEKLLERISNKRLDLQNNKKKNVKRRGNSDA
jgi:type I restriction enzyme S subunit